MRFSNLEVFLDSLKDKEVNGEYILPRGTPIKIGIRNNSTKDYAAIVQIGNLGKLPCFVRSYSTIYLESIPSTGKKIIVYKGELNISVTFIEGKRVPVKNAMVEWRPETAFENPEYTIEHKGDGGIKVPENAAIGLEGESNQRFREVKFIPADKLNIDIGLKIYVNEE